MGTRYAIENVLRFVNRDRTTRNYKITPEPGNIEIDEFDYEGENKVIYNWNDVQIRSWPALLRLGQYSCGEQIRQRKRANRNSPTIANAIAIFAAVPSNRPTVAPIPARVAT
jgi:hypothetical protein